MIVNYFILVKNLYNNSKNKYHRDYQYKIFFYVDLNFMIFVKTKVSEFSG